MIPMVFYSHHVDVAGETAAGRPQRTSDRLMLARLIRFDALLAWSCVRSKLVKRRDCLVAMLLPCLAGLLYVSRVGTFGAEHAQHALHAAALVSFVICWVGATIVRARVARHRENWPFATEMLHRAVSRGYCAAGGALALMAATLLALPLSLEAPAPATSIVAAMAAGGAALGIVFSRHIISLGQRRSPRRRQRFRESASTGGFEILLHASLWRRFGVSPAPAVGVAAVALVSFAISEAIYLAASDSNMTAVAAALSSSVPLHVLMSQPDRKLVRFAAVGGMRLHRLLVCELRYAVLYGAATMAPLAGAAGSRASLHIAIVVASASLAFGLRFWDCLNSRAAATPSAARAARIDLTATAAAVLLLPMIGMAYASLKIVRLVARSRTATWLIED